MTNKETINKNIELTFDFVRQIIDNPKLVNQLPDKCEIEFIESDFSSPKGNHSEKADEVLSTKKLVKVNHTFSIIPKKKAKKAA